MTGWLKDQTGADILAHKTRHQDAGADEISVTGLSGLLADDQHVLDSEVTAVAVAHSLATAISDFLVASGAGAFAKKTLAEVETLLGIPDIETELDAKDYGLSFEGVVTTYTDTTHFKVSALAGKGTGFFKPVAGTPYEIYVVEADGAAPEGEQTPVVAYTTADGTFQHAAFTVPLAAGDIVLIIHPLLASLGTKATDAATGAVTTTDYLMAYIKQLVTELQVVDALVDLIPTTAMRGTDSAMLAANGALEATLTAIKGTGWTTETLKAIKDLVAAIPTTAMRGTDNALLAANYVTERGTDNAALAATALSTTQWTNALATALGSYTAALATALGSYTAAKAAFLDEAISAHKVPLATAWKGSFNWDTSEYTTVEQDISALFSTTLALTTRRKYTVYLDLTNVAADASFVSAYIAVKTKVDGTNYRAIDRKTVLDADIGTSAEPGIIISIPAVAESVQITMQMTVALGADATIYYAVVKEHLE